MSGPCLVAHELLEKKGNEGITEIQDCIYHIGSTGQCESIKDSRMLALHVAKLSSIPSTLSTTRNDPQVQSWELFPLSIAGRGLPKMWKHLTQGVKVYGGDQGNGSFVGRQCRS